MEALQSLTLSPFCFSLLFLSLPFIFSFFHSFCPARIHSSTVTLYPGCRLSSGEDAVWARRQTVSVRIRQWSQVTPILCGGSGSAETGRQLSGFLYVLPTAELFPSCPSPTSLIVEVTSSYACSSMGVHSKTNPMQTASCEPGRPMVFPVYVYL